MENIDKLPKWAQKEFETLKRQRDTAVQTLNDYLDDQAVSPFYTWDYIGTGENQGPTQKIRYIQTHRLTVQYNGIRLEIILRDGIELQWEGESRTEIVALVPMSYQRAELLAKDKMR